MSDPGSTHGDAPPVATVTRVGSVRRAIATGGLVGALLVLTVTAAMVGNKTSGRVAGPSASPRSGLIASSEPSTALLPISSGPASRLALPSWTPPAGVIRRVRLAAQPFLFASMVADAAHLYYETATASGDAIRMLDVASGTDVPLASLPVGHHAGVIAAAAGRVAWVEWWPADAGPGRSPCVASHGAPSRYRLWLRDAAHPTPRILASGVALEMWASPGGCMGPLPPLVALSTDAFAFDVERGGHSIIEVHALADGALLGSYDAGTRAILDLHLAGAVLAFVSVDHRTAVPGETRTFVRWRGPDPTIDDGPGDAVALSADASLAVYADDSGPASSLWWFSLRGALYGASGGIQQLAPTHGAPSGEAADMPAIGAWYHTDVLLWRGIAPDGTTYPVLSLDGRPRVILGVPAPLWTAISGPWAIWTEAGSSGDVVDVLPFAAVPLIAGQIASRP